MNNETAIRTLNERQFAKVVGLSYAKVKQLRQQGLIVHSRIGRRVIYKYPQHVEQFLNQFERAGEMAR